jgi:hypothetical protein
MRTLSQDQIVELLPCEGALVDEALRKFESAAPLLCREAGRMKHLVDEGWIKLGLVQVNGVDAFVIGWRLAPDGGFWVEVAQSLGSGASLRSFIAIVDRLAVEARAPYVRCATYRRGLVRMLRGAGYVPEAVVLTKVL